MLCNKDQTVIATHARLGHTGKAQQSWSVVGRGEELPAALSLLAGDEALKVGDLLKAGDLHALVVLDHSHKFARLREAVVRSRVGRRLAVRYALHVQPARP